MGTLAVPSHSYVTLGTLLNSSGLWMLTSEVEMDPTTYVLPQKAAGWLQEIGKESQQAECLKLMDPNLVKVIGKLCFF